VMGLRYSADWSFEQHDGTIPKEERGQFQDGWNETVQTPSSFLVCSC
jgi:hypothetical protein